jgi:hypothetical protein
LSEPNPRTIATLDKLDSVEWFVNVGSKDQDHVGYVNSWNEAIKSCSTSDWGNLTLEAANQLRERIGEKSRERLNQWNAILKTVKPFSDALVKDKSEDISISHRLPDAFLRCVRWDIFHLCMEAEYSDLVEPAFFSCLSLYYFRGHFPCGFSGVFPQGQLIVY